MFRAEISGLQRFKGGTSFATQKETNYRHFNTRRPDYYLYQDKVRLICTVEGQAIRSCASQDNTMQLFSVSDAFQKKNNKTTDRFVSIQPSDSHNYKSQCSTCVSSLYFYKQITMLPSISSLLPSEYFPHVQTPILPPLQQELVRPIRIVDYERYSTYERKDISSFNHQAMLGPTTTQRPSELLRSKSSFYHQYETIQLTSPSCRTRYESPPTICMTKPVVASLPNTVKSCTSTTPRTSPIDHSGSPVTTMYSNVNCSMSPCIPNKHDIVPSSPTNNTSPTPEKVCGKRKANSNDDRSSSTASSQNNPKKKKNSSDTNSTNSPTLSYNFMNFSLLAGSSKIKFVNSEHQQLGINDGPWTEVEHANFIEGLKIEGRGKWRDIAEKYVKTRTRTQVASHAQKFFAREESDASINTNK